MSGIDTWTDRCHGQFCRFVEAWDYGVELATSAQAGSPKALALQDLCRRAMAGEPDSRSKVIALVREFGEMCLKVEDYTGALARENLWLADTALRLQRWPGLEPRESVRAARAIKRRALPVGGSVTQFPRGGL